MSLYELIPLPPELVHHIVDLGHYGDRCCDRCGKWECRVNCALCNHPSCPCRHCDLYPNYRCCVYCSNCYQARQCKRYKFWFAACNELLQKSGKYRDCQLNLQSCKQCCQLTCQRCKHDFCCEHIADISGCANICLNCWRQVRQEVDSYFGDNVSS